MDNNIIIRGAREHNLKNVSLTLPKRKLIVFTGLSGSGKSSLAFDTLYAEGQRRYIESLSSYARQFLGQLRKPDVDAIEGLSPAISIDQKATSQNPRSTVGTVTEIYDYLRLLYAKVGVIHCGNCHRVVTTMSVDQMVDHILDRTLKENIPSVTIWAPVVDQRKGEFSDLLATLYKRGFAEVEVDGVRHELTAKAEPLPRFQQHTIRVFVDDVPIDDDHLSQLTEAIETALDT
ncbi:MAG: excinuclease ABC subunit UvrA, partial [Patescibacteria group bacterium]